MNKDVNNGQSRREFLGRSVAALAAASFLPSAFSCTGKSVAAPAPVDTAAEARLTRSSVACKSARSLIVGVPCRVDWRISSSIAKKRISVPLS